MTDKKTHIIKAPSPEYDEKYWTDVNFQWADSKFLVENKDGKLVEAGTIVLLRNKIEFLHHLTVEQLHNLKTVISEAVDHELSKR